MAVQRRAVNVSGTVGVRLRVAERTCFLRAQPWAQLNTLPARLDVVALGFYGHHRQLLDTLLQQYLIGEPFVHARTLHVRSSGMGTVINPNPGVLIM